MDSQGSSLTPQFKSISSSALSFLYGPTLTSIHDYWKAIALTRRTFVGKVINVSVFHMLSRLAIAFLLRSKGLLISWMQSPPPTVILKPPKRKSFMVSIVSPSTGHEMMGQDAKILIFECWVSANFFTFLFHFHQEILQLFFTFCHKSGVICVSEIIDISHGNHDSRFTSSSMAFCMMYSAYRLNKQGKNIQAWHTFFPIWNQSVPCPVSTIAFWPAYRFLNKQVV